MAVWDLSELDANSGPESYPKDRFGTKEPFSGTFEHPRPDIFATIGNAFRNAFVQAFSGKIENWKKLPPVKPEKKQ